MSGAGQNFAVFETKGGWCGIAWNTRGIIRFALPSTSEAGAERLILRKLPEATRGAPTEAVTDAIALARRYFDGERIDFSALALDLGHQQPFFSEIYDAVRRLGWGETTTYGAVAKALGAGPEAARDVGQAMANNPIPLIIPCHRVLAAGNKVGGFSAPGGSDAKRRMLDMEGVELAPPKPVQQELAL